MLLTLAESKQHAARAGRGSRRSLDIMLRSILQAEAGAELQFLNTVVAGVGQASKAVVLDSSGDVAIPGEVSFNGNDLETTAGAGITGVASAVTKSSVIKVGGIITTTIVINLDGLVSAATENDIIGKSATAAAHFGRLTVARCGTILGGIMECITAPTTGEIDLDLYSANLGTGVESADVTSGLDHTKIVDSNGDWTAGRLKYLSVMPVNGKGYMYLAVGTGTTPSAGEYGVGKFLITLYGYDA